VTDAYICRLLPLTCLAPDIVEAILDGRQPKGLRLAEVLGNGPLIWTAQRESAGFSNCRQPAKTLRSTTIIPGRHDEPLTRLVSQQRGSPCSAHRNPDFTDAPL
jgi:hypothetical protein